MNKNVINEDIAGKKTLKNFLNLKCDSQKVYLDLENCKSNEEKRVNRKKIKRLLKIALRGDFLLYFDGTAVPEPYDGLQFENDKQEFYYNNGNSHLVFRDKDNFEVAFKVKDIKDYNYKKVYKVVEKAVICTVNNPKLSSYTIYFHP